MELETKNIINNKRTIMGPDFGEMTPIMTDSLPVVPGTYIVIDEAVAKKMIDLAKKTHEKGCEYTFVLIGVTKGGWTLIKGIHENNSEEKLQSTSAEHSPSEIYFIDTIARGNGGDYNTVFICHTHPDKGLWYSNFSLKDIDGMIKDYKMNPHFKNRDIAYGMLTGDKKFIVAFYDPNYKSIYRFPNIIVAKDEKHLALWKDFAKLGKIPNNYDYSTR